MSKPDDIPQDLWSTAARAHGYAPDTAEQPSWLWGVIATTARAIMAERERCAQVCLDYPREHEIVGKRYAAAIRKGD